MKKLEPTACTVCYFSKETSLKAAINKQTKSPSCKFAFVTKVFSKYYLSYKIKSSYM